MNNFTKRKIIIAFLMGFFSCFAVARTMAADGPLSAQRHIKTALKEGNSQFFEQIFERVPEFPRIIRRIVQQLYSNLSLTPLPRTSALAKSIYQELYDNDKQTNSSEATPLTTQSYFLQALINGHENILSIFLKNKLGMKFIADTKNLTRLLKSLNPYLSSLSPHQSHSLQKGLLFLFSQHLKLKPTSSRLAKPVFKILLKTIESTSDQDEILKMLPLIQFFDVFFQNILRSNPSPMDQMAIKFYEPFLKRILEQEGNEGPFSKTKKISKKIMEILKIPLFGQISHHKNNSIKTEVLAPILDWAIFNGENKLVKKLLECGTNPNIVAPGSDFSPLQLAAFFGNYPATQFLLDPTYTSPLPNLEYTGNQQQTAYALALQQDDDNRNPKILKSLREAGADAFALQETLSPFHLAFIHHHPNEFLVLLEKFEKLYPDQLWPAHPTLYGENFLHLAINSKLWPEFNFLMKYIGKDQTYSSLLAIPNSVGNTPLQSLVLTLRLHYYSLGQNEKQSQKEGLQLLADLLKLQKQLAISHVLHSRNQAQYQALDLAVNNPTGQAPFDSEEVQLKMIRQLMMAGAKTRRASSHRPFLHYLNFWNSMRKELLKWPALPSNQQGMPQTPAINNQQTVQVIAHALSQFEKLPLELLVNVSHCLGTESFRVLPTLSRTMEFLINSRESRPSDPLNQFQQIWLNSEDMQRAMIQMMVNFWEGTTEEEKIALSGSTIPPSIEKIPELVKYNLQRLLHHPTLSQKIFDLSLILFE